MTGSDRPEPGSVFWRLRAPSRSNGAAGDSMIEMAADGSVLREVDLDTNGAPVRITRPGESAVRSEPAGGLTRPRSAGFDVAWGPLGTAMSSEEFEATYARADAALPPAKGIRWSRLAALGIVLVAIVATVATVAGSLEEILRSLFG